MKEKDGGRRREMKEEATVTNGRNEKVKRKSLREENERERR